MVSWTKIAKKLYEEYVNEDGTCKICGSQIVALSSRTGYQILASVYRHFLLGDEIHRKVLQRIKALLYY